jgi:histone acetyltransferase (RNA polymerase elongator complex component)
MHKTEAGEKVKALKKEAQELARRAKAQKEATATMRAARVTVTNLQALAAKRLSQAQAQKLEARLEDLQVWEQKKVKDTKKGAKTYTYFMASWREGKKIRNVYLGSSQKMSLKQAQELARAMKREALGLSLPLPPPVNGN